MSQAVTLLAVFVTGHRIVTHIFVVSSSLLQSNATTAAFHTHRNLLLLVIPHWTLLGLIAKYIQLLNNLYQRQGCTNLGCQIALTTKFYTVTSYSVSVNRHCTACSCDHSAVWVVKSPLDCLKMCNPVQSSSLTTLFQLRMLHYWMTWSDNHRELVWIRNSDICDFCYRVEARNITPVFPKTFFCWRIPFWFRHIITEPRILAHVHMVSERFSSWNDSACMPGPPQYRGFTITLSRTPLDEWSVRRTDLWQQTTLTRDRHPCLWGDSNP
jgi:hypothetical protein